MQEQEGLSPEHADMIKGSGIDPTVFAQLREEYAGNSTALHQIRRAELYDEYIAALGTGDFDKQKALLEEAESNFPKLYAWLTY